MCLRRNLLEMFSDGKVGHLGGSCSLTEIMTCLYFSVMRISKRSLLEGSDRDLLILSKGHAVLIQYAALVELGVIPRGELDRVKTLGGMLQGHPDMCTTPGIEANTGSLGQGLSIALGLALGYRLDGRSNTIYTIIGDGELAEGQIWEAAMAITNFNLNSIVAIVDRNRLQATGPPDDRFNIPCIDQKWEAFGWRVHTADGHDIPELLEAFKEAKAETRKPSVIIADTVKGKGFSFAEDNPAFHNASLNSEQLEMASRALME